MTPSSSLPSWLPSATSSLLAATPSAELPLFDISRVFPEISKSGTNEGRAAPEISANDTSDTIDVPADVISPPPVDSRQIPPDGTPCARVRFLHLLPVVAVSIRALP